MAGAFNWNGPTPMGLASYVQGQGDYGRQRGEDSRLARLVSGAMADPAQRKSNLAEIASFRPEAAFTAQDQFAKQDETKYAELGKRAAVLAGAPEAMRGQVWAQLRPELEQTFGMQGLPADVTPEIIQTAQQLAQVYGGLGDGSQEPSSVREARAFQADPSLLDTRRQMYGSYSYGEVPLPDGTVAQTRRNSRTGEMEMVLPGGRVVPMAGATSPQGGPGGMQAPQAPMRQYDVQPTGEQMPTDPLEMEAARRAMTEGGTFHVAGGRVVPGQSGQPSPQPAQQPVNRPLPPLSQWGAGDERGQGFGRSPEAEAAAKKRAEMETELSFADRKAQADANREAMVTGARETAEAASKRQAALPQVITKADQTMALIDKALNHPGLATATGLSGALDPRNYVPGTDATNFRVLLDQLKGQTFLEAFQSLKGGGAITQVEGTKAEQAIARLNTAQSDAEFRQALEELAEVAASAKKRAIEMAGSEQAPQQPPAAPSGWGIQKL